MVDGRRNRAFVFESTLEQDLLFMLLTHPDVADVWDQPPAVAYVDRDGRHCTHTFDFLVLGKNGQRMAIAVKPVGKVRSSGIEGTLRCIREQMSARFADTAHLFTEGEIPRDRAANGEMILRYRRSRNEADIAAVMRAVGPLRGSICIRDVVEKTGTKASAFGAIVCLIDDGVLDLVGGGRIAAHKEVTFAQPLRAHACLESSP